LRIFEAMILKREIEKDCKLDVQILDTLNDGLILRFMENIVNSKSLEDIRDFVERNNLNMLLDNGVYFISEQSLAPYIPTYSQ
jgi:hypothetical protein